MTGIDVARRKLLQASVLAGLGMAAGAGWLRAQPAGTASSREIELQRLVAANRILARENVVDAFGHVSVRDPADPERYVMSRSKSPALVEAADLMVFELDGTPVGNRDWRPYGERMIHGAVYEARADVEAVVHHHAYSVLPYGVTGVPLQPLTHTGSVIGHVVPVWDIRERFGDTDMLVRTMEQGRDLARVLADNTCLLMRGHGAVVTGADLKRAVLTAVYFEINARVQTEAEILGEPQPLSAAEVELAAATQFSPLGLERAWEHFCIRAGLDPV